MFAIEVEQNQRLVRDPIVNDYVSGIAQKLARACEAPFPVSVKIIESEDVNAIALPGGFLFITSGLASTAEDESELAAAMAHQMAHSCAHQFVRGTTSEEFQKAAIPAIVILDGSKLFMGPTGSVTFSLPPISQNFPPKFEAEADRLAAEYLYAAGYDPGVLLVLSARLDALEKKNPSELSRAFASHLQTPSRIRMATRKVRSLPRKDQYIVNSSEFDTVKARLLMLLARRHRNQNKHGSDRSN